MGILKSSCLLLFIATISSSLSSIFCKTTKAATKSVERPLFIGSFNIQNLGQSKMGNKTVMDIVRKVLLRYDLVLVQEIVTTNENLMENLVKDLNNLSPKHVEYSMVISKRLGRGNAKEQYAFIYRDDKLKPLESMTYPNITDDFMRPPYIVHFATPTLRDMDSLIAIGIHTQPKYAANETNALASVYDFAADIFKTKDAIIMGDMNAGCANVRISDWDNIELWYRKEDFKWLITHDIDTTLSTNCCPYDRFVVAGKNMKDAVVMESVRSYKYREEYNISIELALAVSDHWPIEMKLRGSTTKEADANVKPSLCLTVSDERKTSVPPTVEKQKKRMKDTYGFDVDAAESFVELYTESSNRTEVLQNLQKLGGKYPGLIPKEVVDTIVYKEAHGSLRDGSSHSKLKKDLFSVKVYYDRVGQFTEVNYCSATTIN